MLRTFFPLYFFALKNLLFGCWWQGYVCSASAFFCALLLQRCSRSLVCCIFTPVQRKAHLAGEFFFVAVVSCVHLSTGINQLDQFQPSAPPPCLVLRMPLHAFVRLYVCVFIRVECPTSANMSSHLSPSVLSRNPSTTVAGECIGALHTSILFLLENFEEFVAFSPLSPYVSQ